ncbi:sigma-70 family RNA polymerase sigma factor [Fundicoccus sp. Sow4_F4]|uniref:sigma-70 family RNA polymerase sigma factor n=1 Tax=Fundicoccus sp. Sow4_F4 TaxID=3438783 RepID=UPI003F8E48E4
MDYQSLYKSRILNQFEPLIHKTLQRMTIPQRHINYEDYAQELRMKLLTIEDSFDGKALGGDRIRFVAYAGKGLYWYLVTLLRKEQKKQEVSFDEVERAVDFDMPIENSRIELVIFLEEVRRRLDREEYELFLMLSDETLTVTEIARRYGVGRKTIYQRKNKIVDKINDLKTLLL